MWIKFSNSLRLRYAMRMVEKDLEFSSEIIKEIIDTPLPILTGSTQNSQVLERVCMEPRIQNWLRSSSSWAFREHKNLRMGSNIWQQMSENNDPGGEGIFDGRAYIFFETNNNNEWAAFPQLPDGNTIPSGGIPYGSHRDINYSIKGESCIYSPFNYYLIRDEYDVPEVLITGAEVHFIKAEAYLRGIGVAMDVTAAENEFFLGCLSSIGFWEDIMLNSEMWVNINPGYELTNSYDVANLIFLTEDKLELIYAQRWID